MKRRSMILGFAMAAMLTFAVPSDNSKFGGVDEVSAASSTGSSTSKPSTSKPSTSKPSTSKPSTSKPSTSKTSTSSLLKVGVRNNSVKSLQIKLNVKGYNLVADGIFGSKTATAVKDFQGKNGLKQDGIAGPLTLAKLNAPTTTPTTPVTPKPEVISAASLNVQSAAVLEKSIGKDGKWIIATTKDIVSTNALVLDGNFKNGKKNADGTDAIQRKIALYAQDDNKNVTDSYKLTAPKLTINSANARIQGGTFVGDIYVNVPNFALVDANVVGNIHFKNQKALDTFTTTNSIVRGKLLSDVDAVATASLVRTESALQSAIGSNGNWIAGILNDVTAKKDLVIEGEKKKNATDAAPGRKLALYSQITLPDGSKLVTYNFKLTAPSLSVKATNTNLTNGTFKGDIYVTAAGFKLTGTKVEGNIYFATEELKNGFNLGTGTVTGTIGVKTK